MAAVAEKMHSQDSMAKKSNHLGTRARELRKQRGYTQAQIADKIGVQQGHVANLENGTRSWSDDLIDKYAAAVGVTPAELWGPVSGSDHVAQVVRFGKGDFKELQELAKEYFMEPNVELLIKRALVEFKRNHASRDQD
jgi:transcriptional regulator with XRE-family HTH domain